MRGNYRHNEELGQVLAKKGCEQITGEKEGRGGYWFKFVFSDKYEFCVWPKGHGFGIAVNDEKSCLGVEKITLPAYQEQATGDDIVAATNHIIRKALNHWTVESAA